MIPTSIVIHHSASGDSTTLSQLNDWHQSRGFTKSIFGYYIGYHYVIWPNGDVVETRRCDEIGCHTIPNNGKIGICLIGNFMNEEPKDAALEQMDKLVNSLKASYNISNVWGHRDCNRTLCPGDNLYKYVTKYQQINFLQRLITKYLTPPNHV